MASTRSQASPVDRIPCEILSRVFTFCCLNQLAVNYPCIRPCKDEAPLLLLGVCRKWRDYALKTRSLWSRLCVGRVSSRNCVIYATAANAWLDRAGSTPLSIDLCYARYDDENTQDAVDHALQQIFTPERVWKVIFVEICGPPRSGSTCIDAILNTVLSKPHVLERFSFDITGSSQLREAPPRKTIDMGYAPNLSSLSITFNSRIANFRLSFVADLFHNIRDLKIDRCMSNGDCMDILHQCPNVEVLYVSLGAPKQSGTKTIIHTLGKLRALDVNAVLRGDNDIAEFFDALCAPALRELTVDSTLDFATVEPSHWPHLAQFLARSQPPLKSLSLLSTHMDVNDIISCLQHAPQLAILTGDWLIFRPEIMEALTPSIEPARIPICPKLALISLKSPQASFSAVSGMIYARWKFSRHRQGENVQVPSLQVVEMPSMYRDSFLQCRGMAECERHGLDLWLS